MDQYPFVCPYCQTVQVLEDMEDGGLCYACGGEIDLMAQMSLHEEDATEEYLTPGG